MVLMCRKWRSYQSSEGVGKKRKFVIGSKTRNSLDDYDEGEDVDSRSIL